MCVCFQERPGLAGSGEEEQDGLALTSPPPFRSAQSAFAIEERTGRSHSTETIQKKAKPSTSGTFLALIAGFCSLVKSVVCVWRQVPRRHGKPHYSCSVAQLATG